VKEFQKTYSQKEYEEREAIFNQNLEQIRVHNADPASSWKMGINQFTDMREDENFFGLDTGMSKLNHKGSRPVRSGFPMLGASIEGGKRDISDLPESVDWRTRGIISPVKDQGHCGSCWAFAAVANLESYFAKASGELHTMSVQQILDCTPNPEECGGTGGCQGATCPLAYDTVIRMGGIASEWTYPYISHPGENFKCKFNDGLNQTGTTNGTLAAVGSINGWSQVESNSYEEMMYHIAHKGPLTVSVDASRWKFYTSGVFSGCPSGDDKVDINHAVQLVGYGTDPLQGPYWLIRNSWTPKWGEGGYMRLERHTGKQWCGIDDTPDHGSACKGDDKPIKVCGACGVLYETHFVTVGKPDKAPVNPDNLMIQ